MTGEILESVMLQSSIEFKRSKVAGCHPENLKD